MEGKSEALSPGKPKWVGTPLPPYPYRIPGEGIKGWAPTEDVEGREVGLHKIPVGRVRDGIGGLMYKSHFSPHKTSLMSTRFGFSLEVFP